MEGISDGAEEHVAIPNQMSSWFSSHGEHLIKPTLNEAEELSAPCWRERLIQ